MALDSFHSCWAQTLYCAVIIFVNVVLLMQEGISKISGYVEEESQIVSYALYRIPIGIIIIVLSFIWLFATLITTLNKLEDILRVISLIVLLYISPTQLGFLSQEHTKALRKEIQHCFSSYFRTINATIS